MKVTSNWLKDFVEIKISSPALADKLTLAGLEVTSLEEIGGDFVFEIEVTSNRPDWLSVIGVAREVAAITGKKLKIACPAPHPQPLVSSQAGKFTVVIADTKACPFYSARIIQGLRVGASPDWLAKRLRAVGLRPVNNIVDIINYILFTTGQPLHAFDLDKISGNKIIIRRADNNEDMVTIDGQRRKLSPEVLVIADSNKPLAIAGIMGGKDTEVGPSTSNILLESAYFAPLAIRKACRLLGLASDSSYRFERSVDITQVVEASDQAAALITEMAGGKIGKFYSSGRDTAAPKTIALSVKEVNNCLGCQVPALRIKSILKALGFKIRAAKQGVFKITPPAFRQDIKCPADLAEEVCRIYGYDNVPLSQAAIKAQDLSGDEMLLRQDKAREILAGLGFNEVINYSLISGESLKKAGLRAEDYLSLENPLSSEQEILRPGLIIGLLDCLSRNLEAGNNNCQLFEIGNCFKKNKEARRLGLAANKMNFLELKGVLELLLIKLGFKDYQFSPLKNVALANTGSAKLSLAAADIGFIAKVNSDVLMRFKIDSPEIFVAELDLDALKDRPMPVSKYTRVPRYPSVQCDLSLVVNEDVTYAQIENEVVAGDVEHLESVAFKDLYRSKALGPGKKSITIFLEFRSDQRTLRDEEVKPRLEEIAARLSERLKAAIRK